MSNAFGDLRSLCQRPASTTLWKDLCELLDRQVKRVDERQWEEMVAYTRGVLGHWQADLCLAPQRWVDQMFEGKQVPQLAVARALDTRGRDVGDEQVFEMTLTRELQGLAELSMGFSNRVGWRPERLDYGCVRELATCAHLSNLRAIRLTGQHLLPDSFVSLLDTHNAFDALDLLDFSFNDLNFLKPSDLERLKFHPLKHLLLGGCNLSAQGVFTIESSALLEGVETLDVSGNHALTHADLIHLLGNDGGGKSTLKSLDLADLNLNHVQLLELMNHIPHTRLERLDLTGLSGEGDASGRVLSEVLSSTPFRTLRHLTMNAVMWPREDLSSMWPEHLRALESLSLHHIMAHDEEETLQQPWIASLIEGGTRSIDLSHNALDLSWLEGLLELVRAEHPGCTLRLDFNRIDPESEDLVAMRALAATHRIELVVDEFVAPYTYDEEYYEDTWEG